MNKAGRKDEGRVETMQGEKGEGREGGRKEGSNKGDVHKNTPAKIRQEPRKQPIVGEFSSQLSVINLNGQLFSAAINEAVINESFARLGRDPGLARFYEAELVALEGKRKWGKTDVERLAP